MSYYMHRSPWWFHRFETLSNHLIELIFPFFTFLGRRMCMVNGAVQILFQVPLAVRPLTGNDDDKHQRQLMAASGQESLCLSFMKRCFLFVPGFFFNVWTWLDPYELHVSSRAECVLPCQAVVTMVTAHLLFLISLISYFMQTQTSFLQLCA